TRPANNRPFWDQKLARNVARDRRVTRHLRKMGWRVLRIWEHDLKTGGISAARRIARFLA
ncbi:MAG TPA: very short patch repair endonuclease, partial [Phycisphaerae bacterium]|nr:very short patch repair endonuclease [Phycisphaerae bacterium]